MRQQIIQKGDDLKNTIMNILREVKKTLSYHKRRIDAAKMATQETKSFSKLNVC